MLVPAKSSKPPTQEQQQSQENCSEPPENQKKNGKEVVKENGDMNHSCAVRRDEREVDIAPGERLSVAVTCQAK